VTSRKKYESPTTTSPIVIMQPQYRTTRGSQS
jgi:hypothetical protein